MEFKIILTRDATESAHVSIEAPTAEEARHLICQKLSEADFQVSLQWELDEGNGHRPYITEIFSEN